MIPYEVVHMFTSRPFAGSALAVVPDATGLDGRAMAVLAAEFGTVETAFVLPAADAREDYRVRVFQPGGEYPRGSHSAVGTAATLVRLGLLPAGDVVQGCGSGLQTLSATATGATLVSRGTVTTRALDPQPLLAAAGLDGGDGADEPALATGFGAGFALLPVRGGALARARADLPRMAADGLGALCVFAWDSGHRIVRARLFAPGFGIPEDPACGPVATALGLWLTATGRLPARDGTHAYTVHQGVETLREALLGCTITLVNGRPVEGTATGDVTPVAAGTIAVPPPPPV
ncbi:PhzF family phenazine biosynthesis protein [Streptomyces sp. NPDC003860]